MRQNVGGRDVEVCEDCKQPIAPIPAMGSSLPIPDGFVSPESEGMRIEMLAGVPAILMTQKNVCLDCYILAYQRKYPEAEVPREIRQLKQMKDEGVLAQVSEYVRG